MIELISLVEELNQEWYEKTDNASTPFEMHVNGTCANVMYYGEILWTTEDDDGRIDDETVEAFILRRTKESVALQLSYYISDPDHSSEDVLDAIILDKDRIIGVK